jgi:hypothetical protein
MPSHQSTQETVMPFQTDYIFIVSMDVDADKEDLFNEVYDDEHVPLLLKVEGVRKVTRLVQQPLRVSIGGEVKTIESDGTPKYCAIYEIDSPEVLASDAWGKAVEAGRWPGKVRPYTSNRSHVLRKVIASG